MKDGNVRTSVQSLSWLWNTSFDLIKLTKPRITLLVLFTTFVGFYTGAGHPIPLARMCHALIGTALVAGGAAAFNMYGERQLDVLMKRTAIRPLPAGRLQAGHALVFALAISTGGFVYLYLMANHLAGILAAIIFTGYLFLYTPLKKRTWMSTFIGAVPGALPVVLGWTAATHSVSFGAWSLFAIVFLWQMPHFFAIGWVHRKDYGHAGFSLLPSIDNRGQKIRILVPVFILLLIPCSSLPYFAEIAGISYLYGAFLLGFLFLFFGVHFSKTLSNSSAQRLFIVSALYLPILMLLLITDKTG